MMKKSKIFLPPKAIRSLLALLLLLCLTVTAVSCALAPSGSTGTGGTQAAGTTAGGASTPNAPNGYYDPDKLNRVLELFYQNFIQESDRDSITDYLLKGFIAGAGDIYCDYMTAEEYMAFNDSQSGNFVGIGVTVSTDPDTGRIIVIDVLPDSPAETAGLLPSDVLYKLNGEPLIGADGEWLSLEEVTVLVRGEEGTSVTISVLRGNEELSFTMNRKPMTSLSVRSSYFTYDQKTAAVLRITAFDATTPVQFKAAIDDAEAKGVDYIIYDLRNNPGGLLNSVEAVLSYILPDDALLCSFDYKNSHSEDHVGRATVSDNYFELDSSIPQLAAMNSSFYYNQAYADHTVNLPSAVIINGSSASAAELFTSVLRDYQIAVTVGETSYGKGCMQVTYPLGDGSALKVTAAYYNPPCGVNFDRTTDGPIGITPDVEVIFTEEEARQNLYLLSKEEDRQFIAAFNRLTSGAKVESPGT